MKPLWSLYVGLAILVASGIVILTAPFGDAETTKPATSGIAAVIVPALSPVATEGQELFNDTCAACHGDNGKGTKMGPPLIHPIYGLCCKNCKERSRSPFCLSIRPKRSVRVSQAQQ